MIGRQDELTKIEERLGSGEAEWLSFYGRRRIGKTYLIRKSVENTKYSHIYFEFVGQYKADMKTQLRNFTERLQESFLLPYKLATPKNWNDAFRILTSLLIDKASQKQKKIIFLDELPWICNRKSGALEALTYIWNSYWVKDKNVKLIVCGSATSWMLDKIINAPGGVHNRVTEKFKIDPFTLAETKEYLIKAKVKLSDYEIAKLYMVTGGVPFYLKSVTRGSSFEQIVQKLCFNKNGVLTNEFDHLLKALFEKATVHEKIVSELGRFPQGLTREQIISKINIKSGGELNTKIQDLEACDFIKKSPQYKKIKKLSKYRIYDEYLAFYFKWMNSGKISSITSFNAIANSPGFYSWSGYAFERICHKHKDLIFKKLGITTQILFEGSFEVQSRDKKQSQGAQIDWLIERSDNTLTIIEIKFSNNKFILDREYFFSFNRKIEFFKQATKAKKNLSIVFITPHGVQKNSYSEELVDQELVLEDLFKSI